MKHEHLLLHVRRKRTRELMRCQQKARRLKKRTRQSQWCTIISIYWCMKTICIFAQKSKIERNEHCSINSSTLSITLLNFNLRSRKMEASIETVWSSYHWELNIVALFYSFQVLIEFNSLLSMCIHIYLLTVDHTE